MSAKWTEVLRVIPSSSSPLQALRWLLGELDQQASIRPDSTAFGRILQACRRLKALAEGRRTHAHIVRIGLERNTFLGNHLIAMYARCESLQEASAVFASMRERNIFTFSAMIGAFAQTGQMQEAFDALQRMRKENVARDSVVYSILLRSCGNLDMGIALHGEIRKDGLECDSLVATGLVRMYGMFGQMQQALQAFDRVQDSGVLLWNAVFAVYARTGQMHQASVSSLFRRMLLCGQKPDGFTFSNVLNSCTSLLWGKLLHSWILENKEVFCDLVLETSLVNMYTRCGSLEMARHLFSEMQERDVVIWSALISQCQGHEAFWLLRSMQLEGILPDKVTYLHVVNSCCTLEEVLCIHREIEARGFEGNTTLGNALLTMYAKFGDLERSLNSFDALLERDVSSWNSLMGAFAEHEQGREALLVFYTMICEGEMPDEISFMNVLKSCVFLNDGKVIHACMAEVYHLCDEVVLVTALIAMYAKCRDMANARKLFESMRERDVPLWNNMIVACNDDASALGLFRQMEIMGISNEVTVLSLLSSLASLEQVQMVHSHVSESGVSLDIAVENGLMNAYNKFGAVEDVEALFTRMPQPNLASYNAVIGAFAQIGHYGNASKLLRRLDLVGLKWTATTFIKVIDAFAIGGSLDSGAKLHARIVERGFEIDGSVACSLVNFYAKCGSMDQCQKIFGQMQKRDVVSWTVMVAAFAQSGDAAMALRTFHWMQQEGFRPNFVTFIGVLAACSHAGLVSEGCSYFSSMSRYHGVEPGAPHYGCMVDLLGRAGRLEDAETFIKRCPNLDNWAALLSACSNHGDTTRSKRASEKMLEIDPHASAAYVMLANLSLENLNRAGYSREEP